MNRVITALLLAATTFAAAPTWAQATATDTPPTSPPATAPAKKARVAVIKLSDSLLERPESFSISLTTLLSTGKAPALSDLTSRLNAAAADPALSGILLDLSAFHLTLNQAQELGALLSNVRKAHKRVAIYSADFDTATYVLASHADTILMPEQGNVLIPGAGLQMIFFAGTLEKLHMSADFVQVGKFKGAEEPFTRKSASPEYRQQIEKLVDGMYTQIVSTIAANRPNLDEAAVKKAIDEAWLTGKRAKELGLVDGLLTRDRVDNWVQSQFPSGATLDDNYAQPRKKSLDLESPFAIFSLLGNSSAKPKSREPSIAVLYATGEIMPDTLAAEDSTDFVTPNTIRKAVKKALEDDQVKAIVLRIDSPGGSASASDEIWAVLKEADKKKPVTVSMGRLAASGGYYIACAGRSIVADPATITGSIGVVGGKIVLKGTLDWAGINVEPVVRGQHAQMLSLLRPFTDEERAFVKKSMEEVYGVFTARVTAARGSKVAQLDEVTQGRLFTGIQAREVGLVDDIGTLNDAVKAAAKAANLGDKYGVLILPEAKTFADILREGLLADVAAPALSPLGGIKFDTVQTLLAPLPAEVRGPTEQALRLLKTLESERVLLTMPPGLVEK
jgi:protease-4